MLVTESCSGSFVIRGREDVGGDVEAYSQNNGSCEPDGGPDNFTMAWVLVGAALEANEWDWKTVHDV